MKTVYCFMIGLILLDIKLLEDNIFVNNVANIKDFRLILQQY